MEFKICQYKNNAKGAFTFVFDDGCYWESTEWIYEIFKEIYEKTGVMLKGTSAQTVGFISPTLINKWKELFKSGYFDLSAHSINHCLGYNKNTPEEELHKDARDSQAELEKMYGIKPLTYVTPGGGSDEFGWNVLKSYYIANRNGNDRMNIPNNIDWYDIGTFTAMLKRTNEEYKNNIDEAIKSGGWSVQINHWVTKKAEDVFHSQSYDTFVYECNYLAEKSKNNEIWVPTLNEAVLYLQEYEKSTLEIKENDREYEITLACPLDKDIYNYPLTIEVKNENTSTCVDILPNQTIKIGK